MKTRTTETKREEFRTSDRPANGAELLVRFLLHKNVKRVVGIPGGANLPIYDALYTSGIEHVLARHEQGAGFVALGSARITGKAAVCIASSGPGVTNLLTAVADAKCDSVPLIAITGQVPQSLMGTDAFQEIDTYSLSKPITKKTYLVRSTSELALVLDEAFRIAEHGRPGPVWIDIPKDVQLSPFHGDWTETEELWNSRRESESPRLSSASEEKFESFCRLLENAKRPILYAGGGVRLSGAEDLLGRFAEKQDIPVATTLMGMDCFPRKHRLSLGMLGMHGAPYTNIALEESDLLLAFGVRFDDRATGKLETFCPNAKVVHVDIDPREIGKLREPDLFFLEDLRNFLVSAVELPERKRDSWNSLVASWKRLFPLPSFSKRSGYLPDVVLKTCADALGPTTILTTDVGQHQMWAAQFYPFEKPKTWITSGGLGTMGFGLPAAIGVALEFPERDVLCISGDGSFWMNVQELDTLAGTDLNVKILVFDNRHLGLVRQQQELFFQGRFYGSSYSGPSKSARVAEALGIPSLDLGEEGRTLSDLDRFLKEPGPGLVVVPIDPKLHVLPIVPAGKGNLEMVLE